MKRCYYCRAPLKNDKNKFCDQSCSAKHNNPLRERFSVVSLRSRTRACNYCKKEFIYDPKSQRRTNKFCTFACSAKFVAKKHDEKNAKLLLAGKLTDAHRRQIKKALLHLGVKHKCAICGISEWQAKYLPLILDHRDGNASNNNINNLRLLCSNCDSQTSTYKGKNKGRGRKARSMQIK